MSSTRRLGVRGARAELGEGLLDGMLGAVTAGALLAGLTRPGHPLLRDMVSTPHPPLGDDALGLGGAAARAVPQDAVMVALDRPVSAVGLPTWPILGLVTAAALVWVAVAAGALVRRVWPDTPAAVRLAAVLAAVWNPYVVERLLQGHWSLLTGVAAAMTLPVLLGGRARCRGWSRWRRWALVGAVVALGGLTPTGWLLAVGAGAATLLARVVPGSPASERSRAALLRPALGFAVLAMLAATPWLAASVCASLVDTAGAVGPAATPSTGVREFAARAEPGLGTLGSVVALGGIWNSGAVPPSRAGAWATVAGAALLGVWLLALPGLWRARRRPAVAACLGLAVVTWAAIALAATGPGLAALDTLVRAAPPLGLLRDTQKFVAWCLPATVLAVAAAGRVLAGSNSATDVESGGRYDARAGAFVPGPRVLAAALAVGVVLPLSVPDGPSELHRQIVPVRYGPEWAAVDALTATGGGDVLVLPAGTFRSTPLWAGGRPVLDPAPRMLGARVLHSGDLAVGTGATSTSATGAAAAGTTTVSGEDDRARAAERALLTGAPPSALAELGVRWVLDERTSAGPRPAVTPPTGLRLVHTDPELALYEVPGPVARRPPAPGWARGVVLAAHVLWAALLLAGAAAVVSSARGARGRRGSARRGRS